jgi:hypothetical protein
MAGALRFTIPGGFSASGGIFDKWVATMTVFCSSNEAIGSSMKMYFADQNSF